MKTLTATLLAAQKAGSQPIAKVVFTKSGQTTRGYSRWTANALLEVQGEGEDLSSTATIVIDNSDENLTSLDLRGYQAVVSLGYSTTVSETAWQPSTAYSVNDIRLPATSNGYKYICTTAGTSGGSAPAWGTSLGGTTADGAGTLIWTLYGKTGEEYIDRVPLTVRTKSVSNAPTGATYSVAAQSTANGLKDDQASAKYTLPYSDTQTVKTHIAAVLGATRAAYNHTTAYTLSWDSEDSLVDVYKPADSYTIGFAETRYANLRKLLDYVRMTVRVENDGKYHFAEPRNAKAATWVANTAYALRATVKPTTANNHIYVCTTAGTSGNSEPTWGTTIDGTTPDGAGALVWTLTYDYEYDSADGNHIFYAASDVASTVIPNKITVQSDPDTGDSYTGTATDTEGDGFEPRRSFVNLRLASNAQALSIANALLAQAQIRANQGILVSNINCGQEIHDLVRVHDAQLDKYYIGNVGKISYTIDMNSFSMQLSLGKQAGAGVGLPSMGMSNQQWQLNLKNIADIVYVYSWKQDVTFQKIENTFNAIDAELSRIWQKLDAGIVPPRKLQLTGARYVKPGWYSETWDDTAIPVANRVYYMPIFVSESTLYTKIGVQVTTAAAGATVELAIYTWTDGLPGGRILDAGTVSIATTGIKTIAITQTLERGYYFLACRCTSATARLRACSSPVPPVPGFMDTTNTVPTKVMLYVDGTMDDPAAAPTGGVDREHAYVFLEENA